jgi:3-dehydroquinate synthase
VADHLRVNAPGGAYEIVIERGILANAPLLPSSSPKQAAGVGLLRQYIKGRTAVVTNETLAPLYGEKLAQGLPDASLITIPDGEQYKTLETVARLYADFVTAGLDRASTVVALGGGVVGDTAGFAAATYMRGVRLVQVPTSLLAMVDSSVGGKVGVDLPQGKNLVGAFKQPDAVLIDPDVLATLPEREFRCGLAETIKHGLLADPVILEIVERRQFDDMAALVRRAVQVKIDVVEADPYEKGVRAHLNLGHTFAHAVEQVSGYAWPHGEAVGVGLVAAARLSAQLGLCTGALAEEVEVLVEGVGLPTRIGNLDPEALYAAMSTDKKWQAGKSRFVLLEAVGKPRIVEGVAKSDVIAVLESLKTYA